VTVADALMLALGVIAVGSGALVVTSTHLVRAGLYLVISLGAIAGLYLVLGAELVAWVQVLVYVGAVVVLLLFAVMLTRAPIGPSPDLDRPAAPAALIGAGVGFGLTVLVADAFRWTRYELPPVGTAQRVGEQVFGAWVLPFEVLSILLLAALVGAIVLSRPDLGARPDPEAVLVPVPEPDPDAETAEVAARLERIAARQAAAARRRQTAEEAVPVAPVPDLGPAGPAGQEALRNQARDVVFGAHEREVAEGRSGQPALPAAPAGPPTLSNRPTADRAPLGGRNEGRPALNGDEVRPALGGKNKGRPALDRGSEGRPGRTDDEEGDT
jgi:NADH:ubiquinone oxidoreductase subunit 6 (subunit J)